MTKEIIVYTNGTGDAILSNVVIDGVITTVSLSSGGTAAKGQCVPNIQSNYTTGDAISVWSIYTGADYLIQAANYTKSSNTWGETATIATSVLESKLLKIAINSYTGDAVVVWQNKYDSVKYCILASLYNKILNTWSTPINISSTTGNSTGPDVAIDTDGNAIAIWWYYDGSNYMIKTSIYKKKLNSWSSPNIISPQTSIVNSSITPIQIAIDNSNENCVAMWSMESDTSIPAGVYTSTYNKSSNTWSSYSIIYNNGYAPLMKLDNSGDILACILSGGPDSTSGFIYSITYNSKQKVWSTPIKVSSMIIEGGKISIDNDKTTGNCIITYVDISIYANYITLSRYYTKNLNNWSAEKNVITSTITYPEYIPVVKINNISGLAECIVNTKPGVDIVLNLLTYSPNSDSWSAPQNVGTNAPLYDFVLGEIQYFPTTTTTTTPTTTTTTTITTTTTQPVYKYVTVEFAINADYYKLIFDNASLLNYIDVLIDQIVSVTGAPRNSITILDVYSGSIVQIVKLPYEYLDALRNSILGGYFDIIINNIAYYAIPSSFKIIDNICFHKGTMILTPTGYKAIETLNIGDYIKTAQGKKVKIQQLIKFIGNKDRCPLYILQKGVLAHNMPILDLYMSEGHAYRHNDIWTHMKCSSVTMKIDIDNIEYYNIGLDNYIENTLIANGVEVESLFNIKNLSMTWNCDTDNCKPIITLKTI